jgi:sulfate permease, SulP family
MRRRRNDDKPFEFERDFRRAGARRAPLGAFPAPEYPLHGRKMREANRTHQTNRAHGFVETFTPELFKALRQGYSLSDLQADASAGFTVAVVSVPLAMALAVASGAPPASGLVAAIIGGFLISALGGSRFQIGGPASAFVVLVAKTVESHGVAGLVTATIMAGLILLFLGYMKLGSYIKYIPHSVPVGFTAGVALILFASQLKDLLGLQIAHEPTAFMRKLETVWSALTTIQIPTALLAVASLAFIIYQRRRAPRFSVMMTTIVVAGIVTWLLGLPVDTIGSRYGALPNTILAPHWPGLSFTTLLELTPTAIAIAILAAIESLLSAVVADGMTGARHNSNSELVAAGYANLLSGAFGRICCAGALTRTATNIRAGARTPLAGVFAALFLLGFVGFAAPLASHIPMATLAAALMMIAVDMIDRNAIISIFKRDRDEAMVLTVTFLMTVFRDAAEGIAVGVSFGSLLFIHRMAELVELQLIEDHPNDHADGDEAHRVPDIFIYRFDGPLFFGVASTIFDVLDSLDPSPAAFILVFRKTPFIDGSAAESFVAFAKKARNEGKRVIVVGANALVLRTINANLSDPAVIQLAADEKSARRDLVEGEAL